MIRSAITRTDQYFEDDERSQKISEMTDPEEIDAAIEITQRKY